LKKKSSEPKTKKENDLINILKNKINSERYHFNIGVFAKDFFSAVKTINFPSLTPTSK